MISDRKTAARTIRLLNDAFARDPRAIASMVYHRVGCNQALADHPTIQVLCAENGRCTIGLVGVVNGMCGVIKRGKRRGWGMVCSVHDDKTGVLLGFGWTEKKDGGLRLVKRGGITVVAATQKHGKIVR